MLNGLNGGMAPVPTLNVPRPGDRAPLLRVDLQRSALPRDGRTPSHRNSPSFEPE